MQCGSHVQAPAPTPTVKLGLCSLTSGLPSRSADVRHQASGDGHQMPPPLMLCFPPQVERALGTPSRACLTLLEMGSPGEMRLPPSCRPPCELALCTSARQRGPRTWSVPRRDPVSGRVCSRFCLTSCPELATSQSSCTLGLIKTAMRPLWTRHF